MTGVTIAAWLVDLLIATPVLIHACLRWGAELERDNTR